MTIDERVADVRRKWFTPDLTGDFEERHAEWQAFADYLRKVLTEVARDQRHACAEAVASLDLVNVAIGTEVDHARRAVMNAELK